MSRTLIVRGRRSPRRVIWEAHWVTLYMHVGGGNYERVRMETPVICIAGQFSAAFEAMNFPGFPVFDPEDPAISRELVYTGINFPTELEIKKYLEKEMEKRTAALRARYNART